ncbi:MAG: PorT family protein [Winogradskyella sp.]|nr:PorT family protein [Bacteroidia bacterium]NNC45075.1 PorT family protein [Winogradskyella sp.]NNF85839.1 PorT family protein [Winogradskyella sp.]NNK40299.1 PorT family protein [Winogradskyella sp.]
MKTQLLTFAFSLLISIGLSAQEDTNTNKSFAGLKGGYNLAAVSFDGESETGQRHSFHIGFYGESFLNENVSIQPELIYSQQGYEIRDGSGTFKQKLNYLNLPLMLKAYPSEHFFLEIGPQVGVAITHKEEFDSSFNLFDTSQEFNPSSFDWGVNFGGGFKTDTGVSLGVRYHLGLGDVYDDGQPKNRVWQFSLGFDF